GQVWGGQQAESENNGTFYVTWPHEIVDHPVVQRELSRLLPVHAPTAEAGNDGTAPGEVDLFAGAAVAPLAGLDGHQLKSSLQRQVCDWLYLAQLVHAHHRALPCEEALYADFYL